MEVVEEGETEDQNGRMLARRQVAEEDGRQQRGRWLRMRWEDSGSKTTGEGPNSRGRCTVEPSVGRSYARKMGREESLFVGKSRGGWRGRSGHRGEDRWDIYRGK